MKMSTPLIALLFAFACGLSFPTARAADENRSIAISADGKMTLQAPEGWNKVKPANFVIQHELAVPKTEGDERDGRVTITGAGGSVEANIDRWIAQFQQPDGSDSKKAAKVDKKTVAKQEVTVLDIAGAYNDKPPQAAAGVLREKYRMLAAIVVSKQHGNYFVKFYGPEKTVADNAEKFHQMIDSLSVK